MGSFINNSRPLITTMLSANNEADLLSEIRRSLEQGTDAFCFMLENLPRELRTKEKMLGFISAMNKKPVYVSCYERNDCVEETDDERAACLLLALECGADIADVRGDMFCSTAGELTEDITAINKQKKLIDFIHSMEKEALMSSHLLYNEEFHFITKEQAVKIAESHRLRGADISKIVTCADTEEELYECFEAITLLKKELDIPVLFLCSGKYSLRHRAACGLICEPIVFVKEKKYYIKGSPQMPIEAMVGIFKTAGLIT